MDNPTTNPATTDPASAPAPGGGSATIRSAAAHRGRALIEPDGWLDQRRQEVIGALENGWTVAEPWIKATIVTLLTVIGVFAIGTIGGALLTLAGDIIASVHLPQVTSHHTGIATTVTSPVYAYLDRHTAGLPVEAATAFTAWKTIGLASGFLGFAFYNTVARITWTAWAAATLAMVWQGTDPAGRTVAIGLTTAVLAAASLLALRGLEISLRPQIITRNDINPQITVQMPDAKPAVPGQSTRPADSHSARSPWQD